MLIKLYLLHINGFQTLLDHVTWHVKSPPTHHLSVSTITTNVPPSFQHTPNTKNMTCHNQPHNRVCPLFSFLFILLMSFPIYPALAQKTCHTAVFLCSTTPISHPSPSSMKNTPLWCIFCIHQSLQSLPVALSPSTPPLFLRM